MVYHDFLYPSKLPEIIRLFQYVRLGQPRRQAHHKHKILLHNPHVGQVLAVLGDFQLLGLILLPLLSTNFGYLFRGQGLEVCGIFCVGLSASRAQTVAFSAQFVPTKSADLGSIRVS